MKDQKPDRCRECGYRDRCPALVRLLGGPPRTCWWFRLFFINK